MSSSSIRSPHDRLVKRIFTRPEAAAVQLRRVLTPALASCLDWSTLSVEPGSFVDRSLTTRHSDILYAVRLRESAEPALIHVVLEHQSTPDPLMAWRMLGYAVRVWDRFVRSHAQPVERLPLVVPVLLYQGASPWRAPRRLSQIIDLPASLRPAIEPPIELEYRIDTLEGSVLGDPLASEGVRALVEVTRALLRLAVHPEEVTIGNVAPLARLLERVMRSEGVDELRTLWAYVLNAFGPEAAVRDILVEAASPPMQQTFISYYDEAIAKGKAQGEVHLLLRLLERRNLAITEAQRRRISTCSDEELLCAWFDRALTATRADEIFDEGG